MIEVVVQAGEKKQLVLVHKSPEIVEHFIRLAGEGAEVHVDEVFLSDGVQSKLVIFHDAVQTVSRVDVRGVVGKNQAGVSHARVVIPSHAQLSDSFVSQRFLLLDEGAQAEAIPSLEISADDVKASHSAAISHIDAEKIFYLVSRGISEEEARMLIVDGFLKISKGGA